jgi:hypothetical protein
MNHRSIPRRPARSAPKNPPLLEAALFRQRLRDWNKAVAELLQNQARKEPPHEGRDNLV